MDFIDELRQFAKKAEDLSPQLKTEEATKHSLILPFIRLLGYDPFDPTEVVPEFTADVGVKKGERVDYAIMVKGQPAILLEAKPVGDQLTNHDTQLFRYFSVTPARFAILTNGRLYKFYSDLQETNKLDDTPFLEMDLFSLKESQVAELKKFHKESFDSTALYSTAESLKYVRHIQQIIDRELKDPSDDFSRFLMREIYPGNLTQKVLERLKPTIRKALAAYITETLTERLKTVIEGTSEPRPAAEGAPQAEPAQEQGEEATELGKGIETTAEELEAYYIVKTLVRDVVAPKRVTMKDNRSYCAILLDNNTRRWFCRFYFNNPNKKSVSFVAKDKTERNVAVESLEDLYKYQADLVAAVQTYLGEKPAAEASGA